MAGVLAIGVINTCLSHTIPFILSSFSMDQPPRRVGKRLIGRFLLLRIVIATICLITATIGSSFWVLAMGYTDFEQRAQAINTLNLASCASTLSARFTRKSAFHKRSFYGNPLSHYSYAIVISLQVFITYVPGLNRVVFSMDPMDGVQWAIAILMMVGVFIVLETEKCVRSYLASLKYDVDDRDPDAFFDEAEAVRNAVLPDEVGRFGTNRLKK